MFAASAALLRLDRLPLPHIARAALREDMRMPSRELRGDACGHGVEIVIAAFDGELRMEYDLEQQVAQFIAHRIGRAGLKRRHQLMGLFQRVACEASTILRQFPGATRDRIAQAALVSGLDRETIRRLVDSGRLPSTRIPGDPGSWRRIPRAELLAVVQQMEAAL